MADATQRRSLLPRIALAAAAGAAVVVVLLATGVLGGDDEPRAQKVPTAEEVARELRDGRVVAGPPSAPFAMRYTKDWAITTGERLRRADPPALTGLTRKDRTGALTITLRGPVEGGLPTLAKRLPAEIEKASPGVRLRTLRGIVVAAGPALYASWTRPDNGEIRNMLVVPAGRRRSFTVDVLLKPDAREAAAEVGAMLRSFDTAPAR